MPSTPTPLRPAVLDEEPFLGVTYETRLETFAMETKASAMTEALNVLGAQGWQVVSTLDRYGSAWSLTFLLQRRRLVP